MTALTILSGIMASAIHVVSGPDHLAAVTPIVVDSKRKAWRVGLAWGLGHISGMLAIGLLVFFFKELIPFGAISSYSEQLVGLILLILAFWVFAKLPEKNTAVHIHTHPKKERKVLSFSIGFVHGLAGVSHLILLLPVLSFESTIDSLTYIAGFGLGSVLSMVMYAGVIGVLRQRVDPEHHPKLNISLRFATGLFALVVGVFWLM